MKELSPEQKDELAEVQMEKAMRRNEKIAVLQLASELLESRPGKTLQLLAEMDHPADQSLSNEELHEFIAKLIKEAQNAPAVVEDITPAERLERIRARLARSYNKLLHKFSEDDVQILATIPGAEDLEASELRVPIFLYRHMGIFYSKAEIKEKTSCDNAQLQTAVEKLKPFLHPLRGGFVLEEKAQNRKMLYRLLRPKTEEEAKLEAEEQEKKEFGKIRFTIDWSSPTNLRKTS